MSTTLLRTVQLLDQLQIDLFCKREAMEQAERTYQQQLVALLTMLQKENFITWKLSVSRRCNMTVGYDHHLHTRRILKAYPESGAAVVTIVSFSKPPFKLQLADFGVCNKSLQAGITILSIGKIIHNLGTVAFPEKMIYLVAPKWVGENKLKYLTSPDPIDRLFVKALDDKPLNLPN